MIMKKISNIFGTAEKRFTIFVVIYTVSLIMIQIVKRLTDPIQISRHGNPCVYDVYIEILTYAMWTYIMPIILFYVLYLLKHAFDSARVIRMKDARSVWINIQRNIISSSVIIAIFITVVTFIEGYIMTGKICNWMEQDSKAYGIVMKPLSNIPEMWQITLAYAVCIMAFVYVSSTILAYLWWVTDKSWMGYIVAIIILTIENLCKKGLFYRFYIFPRAYYEGINVLTKIVYPLGLCVVMLVLTTVTIRRKDFFR